MTRKPRRALSAATLALLACLALAACGGSPGGGEGGTAPNYTKALAGSPPPLAALYSHPDKLIPGGSSALEAEISRLSGYPVVANLWASWCGPCRYEFPYFQGASAQIGKKVAFLGVNTDDSDDAAATFLREEPLPYPSVTDPDKEVWNDLGLVGLPSTAFYGRDGKLVYLKQGPYSSQADLVADIKHYALGGTNPSG